VALLKTEGLSIAFGGIKAVDNVSVTIGEYGLHAVIGPNGAGKTTFFNLLTGFYRPSSGRVCFDGKDITKLPIHKRCALGLTRSFQRESVFPRFTVYENILSALLVRRGLSLNLVTPSSKLFKGDVSAILEDIGLAELADTPAASLSHGDKKRLELGIALGTEPKMLLLDEPTAGMSPEETVSTMELIKRLGGERGVNILFTEHDMSVVFGTAQRLTVMHEGKMFFEGSPEEVRANDEVQRVYLGGQHDFRSKEY